MDSDDEMTVRLSQIPQELSDLDNIYVYKLIGMVKYRSGHYTTLCPFQNKRWIEIDDMDEENNFKFLAEQDENVQPHLCIYIKKRKS